MSKAKELLESFKDVTLGQGNFGIHLMKNPAGTWSFVGSVPVELSYFMRDGSELGAEMIKKIQRHGPGLFKGVGTRVFKTSKEAIKAAKKAGVKEKDISLPEKNNMSKASELLELLNINEAKWNTIIFLQREDDFSSFKGSGGKGSEGFFDSDTKEQAKFLSEWDHGDADDVRNGEPWGRSDDVTKVNVKNAGKYTLATNSGLGYAGLHQEVK